MTEPCGRGLLWVCDQIRTEDKGCSLSLGDSERTIRAMAGIPFGLLEKRLQCSHGELAPCWDGREAGDKTQMAASVF